MRSRLFYKILGFAALLLSAGACQNQESWMYRQWHNTLAHYNLYFNAEQLWMETMQTVREGYTDDFRYKLELMNYGSEESLKGNQGKMDEAIKKVSTMIDRHPQSKWVDDAYVLMGKAYFLKGDFHAAIDILEYVNDRYEDPEIQFKSQLWIARALAMQDKWEEAESLARSIESAETLPSELKAEAQWVLGSIYSHEGKFQAAAPLLEECLDKMPLRMDRFRLHFLLGQAYQELRNYEAAESHYAAVPKMNPPYAMAFQARMSQVSILSSQQSDFDKANGILAKMLKDDKNLDYLGQIHFKMGQNWYASGAKEKGLDEYRISVRNSEKDASQRTSSYLALGNHYFGIREFETAGLYYDSANNSLDENHPEFETIVAQNEILADLLKHLLTIKNQDSLLRMAKDPEWRELKIKEALAREEAERLAAEAAKNSLNSPPPTAGNLPNMPGMAGLPGSGSTFPFYNENTRTKGIQDFNRSWGPRENQDFWSVNALKSAAVKSNQPDANDNIDTADKGPELEGVSEDKKRFYKGLPLAKKDQDKALGDVEDALLAAAQIYQNRLLEASEAIALYRSLLSRFPSSEYRPQVLYELVKLERQVGDYDAADTHKRMLRDEFPSSLYLKLLENPSAALEDEPNSANSEVQALYDRCLSAYQAKQFDSCRSVKLEADKSFAGNPYQSRFDYLYAASYAREGQVKKAKDLFEQLTEDHPNTPAAHRAQGHLNALRALEEPQEPATAAASTSATGFQAWNGSDELVCLVAIPKGSNANMARAALSDFNKANFVFEENLSVGSAMPMGSRWLIPVINFSKPEMAQQYAEFGNGALSYFGTKGLFEVDFNWISTSNWALLNQKQNWEAFKEFSTP